MHGHFFGDDGGFGFPSSGAALREQRSQSQHGAG
jgi:hypothetical protein